MDDAATTKQTTLGTRSALQQHVDEVHRGHACGGWKTVFGRKCVAECWHSPLPTATRARLLCASLHTTNLHPLCTDLSSQAQCAVLSPPRAAACLSRHFLVISLSRSFCRSVLVPACAMASAAAGRFVSRVCRLPSTSTPSVFTSRPVAALSRLSRTSLLSSTTSFSRHVRFAHDEAPTGPKIESARHPSHPIHACTVYRRLLSVIRSLTYVPL